MVAAAKTVVNPGLELEPGNPGLIPIRVIHHGLAPFCPTARKAFTLRNEIIMLRCKRWTCPYCQLVNAWEWSRNIRYGLALWPGKAYMWTLTMPGWVKTSYEAYNWYPSCWSRLANNVRHNVGEFNYVAIIEGHPRRMGIPHFHVISTAKAPTRLKDMAAHAGFGFQAKEQEIDGPRAGFYVAKYLTKTPAGMPRGFRRIRTSRAWPRLPEDESETFFMPTKHERLDDFFLRVSIELRVPPGEVKERWLSKSCDLRLETQV